MVPLGDLATAPVAFRHGRWLPDPLSAVGGGQAAARARAFVRARRRRACLLVGVHRALFHAPLPGGGARSFRHGRQRPAQRLRLGPPPPPKGGGPFPPPAWPAAVRRPAPPPRRL